MHQAQQGKLLFVGVTAGFAYITLWLLATVSPCHCASAGARIGAPHRGNGTIAGLLAMQPFIEEGHVALRLFPPIALAYLPFCLAGVVLLSVIVGYTGVLFIQEGLQGRAAARKPAC